MIDDTNSTARVLPTRCSLPKAHMEFRILGPLEALDDHDRPLGVGGRKLRALLAAMLLREGRTAAVDELIEALWGESPPATASNTLCRYTSHGYGRSWVPPSRQTSTRRFGSWLSARLRVPRARLDHLRERNGGRAALRDGDPQLALTRLDRALQRWRRSALADLQEEHLARDEDGIELSSDV
jgi:hypothetical protein